MYTHYQQYQNKNSHLVSSASSQGGGGPQWNGSSWVQPQQQQIVPPNPVQTFTQYYHDWTRREQELSNQISSVRNDNERQTIESNRQWAKYYAGESSRAAHHFHENPMATSAPFDLPPAPPAAQPMNQHGNNRSYAAVASTASPYPNGGGMAKTATATTTSNSTGSITRYVKRNIERPEVENDPKIKAYVQSEIEKAIAAAIQNKTFQSKNWDLEPMISFPGAQSNATVSIGASKQAPSQLEQNYYGQQQPYNNGNNYTNKYPVSSAMSNGDFSNSGNYYGPAASHSAPISSNNFGGDKLQNSTSYYGPASSHNNNSLHNFHQTTSSDKNNNNTFSSSSFVGKNKKRQRHDQQEDFGSVGSYYGPSSGPSPSSGISSNKKVKNNNRKNKFVVKSTNNGMDDSERAMAKRASRFSGRGGIQEATIANFRSSCGVYGNSNSGKYMGKGTIGGSKVELDETDFEQMTVKGTSTTLEKEYLRLTAPPRAEFVRPFHILKQHLRNLQNEYFRCDPKSEDSDPKNISVLQDRMKTPQADWKNLAYDRHHDYLWFCSQLKAIRQDCTVQRIQCDLAVDVYETHARIALQEGDLNEYNQCQTQLKELYKSRPEDGSKDSIVLDHTINDPSPVWKNQEEFIAYRILYYVFLSTNEKYSGGSSDIFHIMLSLTSQEQNHPAIRHALKVREAVTASDYFWFFRLHKSTPNLGVFLTDLLVPTMRMRGLRRVAKAYRPSIDLIVCLKFLGFSDEDAKSSTEMDNETNLDIENNDSGKNFEEGKTWLISCGGIIEGSNFITKDSDIHAPETEDVKNSLI